jgi:DNA-binding SARP family transcriptional activator
MLEIATLGGLTIRRDGQNVTTLASRKAEALLLYLACTGRAHAREVLAELLWDERSQEQALTNLRKAIAVLRRELAPYLHITRQAIGLNASASVQVDIAQLENGLRILSKYRGQADGLSASAADQLEHALALYRGDFLVGFYIRECQGF